MCGIYGTTIRYNEMLLEKKLDRIKFRGPDHTGFRHYKISTQKQLTLGHNRLSIIDLEKRSNQPFDYNESISIVFNGEIYNYKELKKTYIADYKLQTTSDTEVICAMYERFGEECLYYLNGMFAFVIYDHRKQILFGARDRLGKKPFYYQLSDKGIEFSSQLSQIQIGNSFTIDETARLFYLMLSYIPDPYCIYKEVKKLKPGHCFTYSICDQIFREKEYWNPFCNSCNFDTPKSYIEAKETVKELLYDSVKHRLMSDVPVGVFLSGGIDSSLVAAIVSQVNPQLSCFNIGFKEKKFDESKYANAVAQALHLPFVHSYCDTNEMLAMLNNFTYYWDEPFGDISLIPTSLVAQKAKEKVTVVLGGDGGDELFWGYSRYFRFKQMDTIYKYPLLKNFLYYCLKPFQPAERISEKLQYSNVYDYYLASRMRYGNAEKYIKLEVARELPNVALLHAGRGLLSPSDYDMAEYMNSCINTKNDRGTMRFSLELRNPIMDYRLAEYSRLLPFNFLYDTKMGGKKILKDILYGMIDKQLFDRPKQGFRAPIGKWFKNELKNSLLDTISLDNLEALFPELVSEKIITYRDNFLLQGKLLAQPLWNLYSYILWYRSINL